MNESVNKFTKCKCSYLKNQNCLQNIDQNKLSIGIKTKSPNKYFSSSSVLEKYENEKQKKSCKYKKKITVINK